MYQFRESIDLKRNFLNCWKAIIENIINKEENLQNLNIGDLNEEKILDLMNMDSAENVEALIKIGEEAAKRDVKPEHLPNAFNLKQTV